MNSSIISLVIGASNDRRTNPSTDNNNILNQASVQYAQRARPTSFAAIATGLPKFAIQSREANTTFDILTYEVYISHSPNIMFRYLKAQM